MSVTIVFIHLGTKIPGYLKLNLQRTKALFPEHKVVLVTNIRQKEIKDVIMFKYSENLETQALFSKIENSINMNFRKGYWKFTLQRLFALGAYHAANKSEKVLHVESDVILMPNMPFSKFYEVSNICWMRANPDHDIAALIFSPDSKSTHWMIECLKSEIIENYGLSDMKVMSKISHLYPQKVSLLPTLNRYTLRSLYPVNDYVRNNEKSILFFGGYFDALGIGVWNFGLDPRHNFGYTKYFHDFADYYVDPKEVTLSFSKEEYLVDSQNNSVFSLHIHSKNSNLFSKNWESEIISILNRPKRNRTFSFLDLIKTAKDYPIRNWFRGTIKYVYKRIARSY